MPRYYFHLTRGKQVLDNHKSMNRSDDAVCRLRMLGTIKRGRVDSPLRSSHVRAL
jgi:hypothetical protein